MSRGSQIKKWSAATASSSRRARQDGGLDAARIAQALQDELIGGGGALLALLHLGEVAIDGDGAARSRCDARSPEASGRRSGARAAARRDCGAARGAG